jgi:aminoglycoside phosphotransferase (APT) family kinase protein
VVAVLKSTLRRADWRFLLPAPLKGEFRHLALLGGPPQLADQLLEAGVAARISTSVPAEDTVDALVLLAGSGATPATAGPCLAPDGVLYWEIQRRRSDWMKGAGWIHRHLKQTGFQAVGLYWVMPGFPDARLYIPLDHGGTVEWFFETQFVASTPRRLGFELLVKTARLTGRQSLAAVIGSCAVVATRRGQEVGPAFAFRALTTVPELQARGTRALLITSGRDDGSRLVLLPFGPRASRPTAVVKIARLARFTGHTEREQATLSELRRALDPGLRTTVPEPLGMYGSGAYPVFRETPIPGRTIASSSGRWRASSARQISDLRLASDWIARFHSATLLHRVRWDEDQIEQWLSGRFDRYTQTFGAGPEENDLFAAARERARSLVGERIPIVWSHNDYGPWHVYRSGADLAVIDWEFGGPALRERWGLPLCDLVYFVTHWTYLARGLEDAEGRLGAFKNLFLAKQGSDLRGDAARDCLTEYLQRLQTASGFLGLLVVHTWVERAIDHWSRQDSLDGAHGEPRSNNPFISYVGALAQGVDRLFGTVKSAPTLSELS